MFIFSDDCKMIDLGNGIQRKILAHGGSLMAVEVHFSDDAIGYMHHHEHEQLTYVLSGEFDFTIGEETKRVKAGDTLYKKPNIEHGCVCVKAGVLLDLFTPQRADFL